MEKKTTNLRLEERGVMLSCYFCGTPGVMLPVSVDNKTTIEELITLLEDEIDMVWDHVKYTAEHHNFKGDLEKEIESQISEMKKYISDKKSQIAFPNLDFCFEDEDEDDLGMGEYPVCIFTIEFFEE